MKQTHLGIVRLAEPIHLPGIKDDPVDLFVFTVGPSPDQHVHEALMEALRIEIRDAGLAERLRSAEGVQAVKDILQECAQLISQRA